MEYKSDYIFSFEQNNRHSDVLLNENLSKISTDEIKSFVNRLNLYIQHFDILTRKSRMYEGENKLTFLKKLKVVLMGEMEARRVNI